MSSLPARARVVVVGAGIVGNSVAHHLARLGWRDLVQIDKGPLPNPGGSTGHASNFIFPVDHSREMTDITRDSVRQYSGLGCFIESGGYEVARSPERMQELTRRMTSAKAWGIDAEIVSPKEVQEKVPFLDPDVLVGGFWTPSVGVVESVRAGTLMREQAIGTGALTTHPNTEVLGVDVENGRVARVRTTNGDIETDYLVVACGVWSPKIARMAGAHVPLTPAVHQMISVGPVPQFQGLPGEINFPIIRDMDTFCYERQHGGDMEVGSYAHRPILWDPEDIPSIEQATLSPTELPFTSDDFDPQLEQALELMPDILGNPAVGIRYAINGLLSLTPDGFPILGESPEVGGLWSAAAVWVKEGPGTGRAIAEWMVHGESEIDVHHSDIARFYPHQRTREHVRARTSEAFNKTYGIVHPGEQWASNRDVRLPPMHAREVELGAVFFETAGWERPHWYESNAGLVEAYGDAVMPREAEWDSRWWSPIINAEHLAMREAAGVVDLTAFSIFDVVGPRACEALQRICVLNVDVPAGRVVYTPVLSANGGFRADLTVMRLGVEHYRVVTGGAHGNGDRKWFADNMPEDGGAYVVDQTSAFTTIGIWGPKAREVVQSLTRDDMTHTGFPFGTCREVELGGLLALASRISYVGELGWELYLPVESGARAWDMILEAGAPHGAVPVGIGVYGTTGRIEKGYRAFGTELDLERNIVEVGMQRPKVKAADFIGKAAYLAQRETEPVTLLCSLTVDDHMSSTGVKRYMLGGEPVLTLEGGPVTDAHGRNSYVTTAGSAPSLGKHVLMAFLPPAVAVEGTRLKVEYLGEHYPVTVAVAGSTPLFDPENARIRA
jgi:glycine cleavage system aminomethyltransferase T/glycine/D-amino acid oxidase-like deaminating enzyme